MPDLKPTPPTADELICASLRGESPAWPWGDDPAPTAEFHARANLHGVIALLHNQVQALAWPAPVAQTLRAKAIQLAMWELRHQQVLTDTLEQLHRIGVQPILIKGTALAYQLYASPALRSRGDTDLIIPEDAKARVHEALESLGYERPLAVSGDFVSYQASYTRQIDGGSHTLDLHWKINNSELLSRLFTYEELRRSAEPVPALCPHALGACGVHALLIACMHRSTHKQNPYYVDDTPHHDPDRLIWLYDIHLLARHLNDTQWDQFVQLATQKGLRAVCLEGMRHAQACFHTEYPKAVVDCLAQEAGAEPAARYLGGSKLRQQWMDFAAIGNFAGQIRWLKEVLFPSAAYMQSKYPDHSVVWLPWLYLRRAADGFTKRLTRSTSPS